MFFNIVDTYGIVMFDIICWERALGNENLDLEFVDPEKWNYKADAYAYMFKYLDI